jgi:hypothetical protein
MHDDLFYRASDKKIALSRCAQKTIDANRGRTRAATDTKQLTQLSIYLTGTQRERRCTAIGVATVRNMK